MGRKANLSQVKLQIPINQKVYSELKKRASDLGFDSVQAYVRFWARSEAATEASICEQTGLNKPSAQALRYVELLLALNKQEATSVQEALDHILKQLKYVQLGRYLEQLFKN